MDYDYTEYVDYSAENGTEDNLTIDLVTFRSNKPFSTEPLVVMNAMISILGLGGNALVIWICGFKMRKTVTTTWYFSLAISDFLFCALLPLDIVYHVTSHWPFGLVMCKLTSSALFLNMFSSVFLLALISVDRCLMIAFPIWSQNHRTLPKACGVVVLMWALSATLTVPSLLYRQTKVHGAVTQCYTDYMSVTIHWAVALTRFICGFMIPFVIIIFCGLVLTLRLRSLTMKSTKPFKVIAALIVSFFVCWVPFHAFVLIELRMDDYSLEALNTGLKVGATLAATNSFINPILYVFIGNDFRLTLRRSFLWRIENAIQEGDRTDCRNISKSFEGKATANV